MVGIVWVLAGAREAFKPEVLCEGPKDAVPMHPAASTKIFVELNMV